MIYRLHADKYHLKHLHRENLILGRAVVRRKIKSHAGNIAFIHRKAVSSYTVSAHINALAAVRRIHRYRIIGDKLLDRSVEMIGFIARIKIYLYLINILRLIKAKIKPLLALAVAYPAIRCAKRARIAVYDIFGRI